MTKLGENISAIINQSRKAEENRYRSAATRRRRKSSKKEEAHENIKSRNIINISKTSYHRENRKRKAKRKKISWRKRQKENKINRKAAQGRRGGAQKTNRECQAK